YSPYTCRLPTDDLSTLPYTTLFRSDPERTSVFQTVIFRRRSGDSEIGDSVPVQIAHWDHSRPEIALLRLDAADGETVVSGQAGRSEEHTSELQSRENLVCRLLLEKH